MARLTLPRAEVLALAEALRSTRDALNVIALRLAENAGWVREGECARAARRGWKAIGTLAGQLHAALQSSPLRLDAPAEGAALAARFLEGEGADPLALSGAAETLFMSPLSPPRRRALGAFYTPPEIAALVVELGLAQGSIGKQELPSVIDPCVGAGAFVAAAARALRDRRGRRAGALACGGADLGASARTAARIALALEAGPEASRAELEGLRLLTADSLFDDLGPPADLLVSNPPYGHVDDPKERALIAERYPALRGGEIDRYAAFLLRSLELVRLGGTVALLIPDTWMTNSRGGPIRAALLRGAELCAVVDLGKPFASAKDTRVQAVVLVRRGSAQERPFIFAGRRAAEAGNVIDQLAPLEPRALLASVKAGWQPYRTAGERDLCAAMDAASVPLGSVCEVGYGLRTGDNGRHVQRGELPADGVALLGGEDIVPFALRYKPKFLGRESVKELTTLVQRQLGRPRVAIQRIRTNSTASWARWLEAAICPPEMLCLDSISTLAWEGDERLWALLGLICSTPMNRYHRLRTTDVNVKPSLLGTLPLPRKLLEPGGAARLAELSRARAEEAAVEAERPEDPPGLERQIDKLVYQLFSLCDDLVEVCERGHWGNKTWQR